MVSNRPRLKLMKSPIKDRRFKNLFVSHAKELIPASSRVHSYGLFAGTSELSLSHKRHVSAFTSRAMIFHFWHCLMENPEYLYSILTDKSFKFYGAEDLEVVRERLPTYADPYYRSALFFLLNRCSVTGQVSCGKLDLSQYTMLALSYLRNFKKPENFQPCQEANLMEHARQSAKECDFVLFPTLQFSYNLFDYGKSLSYDTQRHDHVELRRFLSDGCQKTILVYKAHPVLKKFYKDFNFHLIDRFGNLSDDTQNCEEIIVTNF